MLIRYCKQMRELPASVPLSKVPFKPLCNGCHPLIIQAKYLAYIFGKILCSITNIIFNVATSFQKFNPVKKLGHEQMLTFNI